MDDTPKHPFGRENEVSVKKLLQSFCNNLSLGQWECAKACIKELEDQKELIELDLQDILLKLVKNPYLVKGASISSELSNPHLLSWLSLDALRSLPKVEEAYVNEWRDDIEFRLLLVEYAVLSGGKVSALKELYQVFLSVRNANFSKGDYMKFEASFRIVLEDSPTIASKLTLLLIKFCNSTDATEFKRLIENVYMCILCVVIEKLRLIGTDTARNNNFHALKANLLTLISQAHVLVCSNPKTEYIQKVLIAMVELTFEVKLESGEVYSCLFHPNSLDMLREYCKKEIEMKRKNYCNIYGNDLTLSDDHRHYLGLVLQGDKAKAWRELFHFCWNYHRHFVDITIELVIKLVKARNYQLVTRLLSVVELSPMKPLALLIAWDRCEDIDSASELLKSFEALDYKAHHELHSACELLKEKHKLLEIFAENHRKLCGVDEGMFRGTLRREIFSGVQLFSILAVLNICTPLPDLDARDVLGFIAAVSTELTDTHCRLVGEESKQLYLAYNALKTFTEALIVASAMNTWSALVTQSSGSYSAHDSGSVSTLTDADLQTRDSAEKDNPVFDTQLPQTSDFTRTTRSLSMAASNASASDIEELQSRYNDQVIRLLDHVKESVMALECIEFRIEILENLFSLLFLRAEDIQNPNDLSESGEEGADLSLSVGYNQTQNSEPVICHTPGTPTSPPKFFSPDLEVKSSPFNTLLEDHPKINREQFTQKAKKKLEFKGFPKPEQGSLKAPSYLSDVPEKESKPSSDQHSSSFSFSSSNGLRDKHGFLANEYSMRDALILLKGCLEETSLSSRTHFTNAKGYNVRIQTPGEENGDTSASTTKCNMKFSIKSQDCKKRHVTLTQHISEALWCFQLVSHDSVPFQFGKILGNLRQVGHASSDEELDLTSEDELENESAASKQVSKTVTDVTMRQSSDSHTDGSQKSGARRRRKRRRHRRSQRAHVRRTLSQGHGIVSRMLADKHSYLAMCLRRGKVSQAAQVVKLLGLEDTKQEAEVVFAEHFNAAVAKLKSQEAKKPVHKNLAMSEKYESKKSGLARLGKRALANVESTAARGLVSVSITSTVDQLLTLNIQPSLLESAESDYDTATLHTINERLVPAMIVLDLASAAATSLESSSTLINMAIKKLPKTMTSLTQKNKSVESDNGSNKPQVFDPVEAMTHFVHNASALISRLKESGSSSQPSGFAEIFSGLNGILGQGVISLNPERVKEMFTYDEELRRKFEKAKCALLENNERHGIVARQSGKSLNLALRLALKDLIVFMDTNSNSLGLLQYIAGYKGECEPGVSYVKMVYDYFKTLSYLKAEADELSKEEASKLEYFDHIYISPSATLGEILFLNKRPPARLEKIVGELGVDLVDVIIDNCCAKLPFHSSMPKSKDLAEMDTQGVIVLNRQCSQAESVCDAGQCVQAVLASWIQSLKVFISKRHHSMEVTLSDLQAFAVTVECEKLMKLTAKFQSAQEACLPTDRHRLCFFVNLWQLMTLHAVCYAFSRKLDDKLAALLTRTATVEKELTLSLFCYQVAGLGSISLQDLNLMAHELLLGGESQHILAGNSDPWRVFQCEASDIAHAVMSQVNLLRRAGENTKFQVFYPELLQEQYRNRLFSSNLIYQRNFREKDVYLSVSLGGRTGNRRPSFSGALGIPLIISPPKEDKCSEIKSTGFKPTPETEAFLNSKSEQIAVLAKLLNLSWAQDLTEANDFHKFPALKQHLHLNVSILRNSLNILRSRPAGDIPYALNCDIMHCVLSLVNPKNQVFQEQIKHILMLLLYLEEWDQVKKLLLNCPAFKNNTPPEVVHFYNFATKQLVKHYLKKMESEGSENEYSSLIWRLVMCISDLKMKTRLLLECLVVWDAQTCVRHLEGLLHTIPMDDVLYPVVREKLHAMKVYMQICQHAQTQLDQGPVIELRYTTSSSNFSFGEIEDGEQGMEGVVESINKQTTATLESLLKWQNVQQSSIASPDMVLEFLLKINEYELTKHWVEIHKLEDFNQLVNESHILYQLEKGNKRNLTTAMRFLHQMKEDCPKECKILCFSLINQFQNKDNTAVIARFMLQNLSRVLSPVDIAWLWKTCVGCKALAQMPRSRRDDYEHLVSEPLLLLEQLLMNLQIDLASKVLQCIKQEIRKGNPSEPTTPIQEQLITSDGMLESTAPVFTLFRNDDHGELALNHVGLGIDLADLNMLLVKYAEKALEFPVIEPNPSMSGRLSFASSRSLGSMSSLQGKRGSALTLSATAPSPNRLAKMAQSPMTSHGSYSSTMAARQTARSVPRFTLGSPDAMSHSPQSSAVSGKAGAALQGVATGEAQSSFVMPLEAPLRQDWVPDNAATVCMCCGVERFSMFTRRHHCRRCGRVVCSECSSKTLSVGGQQTRACEDCYTQTYSQRPKLAPPTQQERMDRMRQSLVGTPTKGSFGSNPSLAAGLRLDSSAQLMANEGDSEHGQHSFEYQYILTTDDELNDETREEFYYDHAPNAALCLSILNLHSSAKQSGEVLLDICDHASKYLQPIAPGVKNPEVDYGLVVSMLKTLLLNAKMRFHRALDSAGISKCDLYLERIKLIDLLVSTNVSYIPSIQQLTRIDVLRRIRDKLIESEHWDLANEISTKCGIDSAGVWLAWGKSLIKCGDYASAREKFAKCIKIPVDRNQPASPTKHLTNILSVLESSTPLTSGSDLLSQLKSMKDLLAEPQLRLGAVDALDNSVMQECLFYVHTYGTYGHLVSFYQRHGHYIKALGVVHSERCSSEIFMECLVMPAAQSGEIVKLQDAMLSLDSSLARWGSYLTALCKHLNKNKMMHMLYRTQLFMKDYIRAAMSCVTNFYQKDASSYRDLYERLHHLTEARQHMERYLAEKPWVSEAGAMSRRASAPPGEQLQRLIMTPREISKYIQTIDLQVDATKYFNNYLESLNTIFCLKVLPSSSPTKQTPSHMSQKHKDELPTLFGSTRMKADVTCLMLLCGNNINDGFGLAFRIIQDFKLDSGSIYTQVGTTLARMKRYAYIKQLLSCMKDSGMCNDQHFDDVIIPCVDIMSRDENVSKEIEDLIKMLKSDVHKINAYIQSGKLKPAYLLAVKTKRADVVKVIAEKAEASGQTSVKNICDKWLRQQETK